MTNRSALIPGSLRDAPALIESVFPAQKVSFEAQKERKAQASQTLTALGSFWKGRKPLILVRAVVLGALLPATDDPEQDLDVFERLMAFDEESLARRALANNAFNVETLQELIPISDPERYFSSNSGWRRDIGLAESSSSTAQPSPPSAATKRRPPCASAPRRSMPSGSTSRCGPWSIATMHTWASGPTPSISSSNNWARCGTGAARVSETRSAAAARSLSRRRAWDAMSTHRT